MRLHCSRDAMIGRETRMVLRQHLEHMARARARSLVSSGSAGTAFTNGFELALLSGSRHDACVVLAMAARSDEARRIQRRHRNATRRFIRRGQMESLHKLGFGERGESVV